MAHELDFTTGNAAIAYTGQVPWHGFGANMTDNQDLDAWRVAAGLNWEVQEYPLVALKGDGAQLPIPDRKALARSDTGDALSIVSSAYKVFQPAQVFDFFREEAKREGFTLETAGALAGGRRIWALARIGDAFTLFGRDTSHGYVLMATSYDGLMATQAMLTSIRVVCNNTMRASGAYGEHQGDDRYAVAHRSVFDTEHAKGKLGLNEQAWMAWRAHAEQMARFRVSPAQALEFFFSITGQGDDIERNADNGNVVSFPNPTRTTKLMIDAYKTGPGSELVSANGTAYGLLNAVTYYQDHLAPASDNGQRFNSATFGGGARRKQKALELIDAMMEAA